MDLLVLESVNDDPVVKSSVKGITSVTTVPRAVTPQERTSLYFGSPNLPSPGGPGTLVHTNTNSSTISNSTTASGRNLVTTTSIEASNERIMYPFRVKHLGKPEVYVLYAATAANRHDWCEKEAKTRHAASLFAQNAEPFRLRVMADTAFCYESGAGTSKGIVITGTPLDRAIREVETVFKDAGQRPGAVSRTQVNCATAFNQPFGKKMIAVGTDYGVFISPSSSY